MVPCRWPPVLAITLLWAAASDVYGQRTRQDPHIGYVFPAGGQAGASFDVTVGGQYLMETADAHISGGGVRVKVTKHYKPLTQGEYSALRNKLNEARERLRAERAKDGGKAAALSPELVAKEAGVTPEQLKEMEIYEKRAADPKRQPNAQILEEVSLHVDIAPDAPVGERELRLITPAGMSNPVWFHVAQWPERRETEPNDRTPDPAIGAELPAVANGQIMPGDVDRFSFKARKGARLAIVASARELIPYLADAVPGWFQAVLVLWDSRGKEAAYAGAYYFRQDPVIYYEAPEDGEYVVEIRDSIYRGREDFVYRITIGELPFVTGVFPLGGRAGTKVAVELQGWNLLEDKLNVDAYYDRGRPVRFYTVRQTDKVSVRVPLAIDMLPDCLEQEPNNDREHAQGVPFPIIVNGRIDQPGDCDVFRFEAHGSLVAEVYARRFGSPVDSVLRLTDAAGGEVASNDDYEDKGMPLLTHHADSRIQVVLPALGTYCLRIADAQRKGGKDFIYRLHIRRPRPDFELRVVPSSIVAPPGSCAPIAVHVLRREGFNDDIVLSLEEAPAGFALSGAWAPAGQDKVRLTLTVPTTPTTAPVSLAMEGRSRGRGLKITRPAVPAEQMMQAFAYQHLVPAKDWTVFVPGPAPPKPPPQLRFDWSDPVQLPAGGTVRLVAFPTGRMAVDSIRVELSEPPDGVTVESSKGEGAAVTAVIRADARKVQPGLKGNLMLNAYREWSAPSGDGQPSNVRRSPLGLLPAVPFEVVAPKAPARKPRR